jgi:hypothetical protein
VPWKRILSDRQTFLSDSRSGDFNRPRVQLTWFRGSVGHILGVVVKVGSWEWHYAVPHRLGSTPTIVTFQSRGLKALVTGPLWLDQFAQWTLTS